MTHFVTILLLLFSQPTAEPDQGLQASMFLGARSASIQRKLPVLKQVVLVPDEATYLDEISKWSTTQRWPVLFDRESLASQFIRKFKPDRVLRRVSVGNQADEDIKIAMQKAVANAWGGTDSIQNALTAAGAPPLGLVCTDPTDSARTGAVALAAGRGQLLGYISGDWGKTNATLSAHRTTALMNEVEEHLKSSGVQYGELGDTIDAITLCMNLPARVQFNGASENPVAITDVIGRNSSGKRFAWTGWIFGSKAESAYMAMCSLFLERDQYWLCHTYPNNGGWSLYGLGNAGTILPQYGIDATIIEGTLRSLQLADVGGVTADVMYFTSKGNQDFLDMSDARTSPNWLPILDTPATLFFVHSWSLKNPFSNSTVGGTWLSRGVYAYVGSSHEPTLNAFVPPNEMLRRTMSLIPFIPAARWEVGQSTMSKPWRVNTIGDPLMLCPPRGVVARTYLDASQDESYIDVSNDARHAMQLASDEPTDEHFANAIGLSILLGRDDMALALWAIAMQQSQIGAMAARKSLPVLFRNEEADSFLWAFRTLPKPTRLEKDMLWHLVGSSQNAPVQLLVEHIRAPYACDDITLIADQIMVTMGRGTLVSLINKELQNANGRNSRELQRMKKQYGE